MASGDRKFYRYRFVIAGLILAAHLSVGLNFFSVSPVLPLIMEDFGITRTTASLLVALALLVHAVFGLPGGVIAARFGVKRVYFLAWLLVGMSVFSSFVNSFSTLLILRLAYGIGFGVIIPATAPLLMQWLKPREITVMNGLDIAALTLGVALSVTTVAPIADGIGWKNALSVFGAIALLGALAWAFLGRERPLERQAISVTNITFSDISSVLRNPVILLLAAADALVFMQYTALTGWLPTFYGESRNMSLAQAGFITGLIPLIGVGAVLAGGILPLRISDKRIFFVVPGFLIGIGGLGSFLLESNIGILASVLILGIGSWSYAPTLLSLPMGLKGMTPEKVAVVWGTFVTVSGIGMFVSPIVVGAIRDYWGTFVPGFMIWAIGAWLLFIAGFALPPSVNDYSEVRQSEN